jgi:hypothetical protein
MTTQNTFTQNRIKITNDMTVEIFVPQERVGDPISVYSSFLIAEGCKEHVAIHTMN